LQKRRSFYKPLTVCTLAIYFRVFENYPLIVAANRDEHYDRPSDPPRLLESTPEIIAGRDLRAGGTWLGINQHGVMAGILNRRVNESARPLADTRSRGLLCMDVLQFTSSRAAGSYIRDHRSRYNPFALLFADKEEAYVCYNDLHEIVSQKLQPGLHVFSSAAEFAIHSAKAERAYSLFARLGDRAHPQAGNFHSAVAALQLVLADHSLAPGSSDPGDAICVHRGGSGTVSASIVFLCEAERHFETYYCEGAPCRNAFAGAQVLGIR
jgi:uncharacterized protein with NRDE domain